MPIYATHPHILTHHLHVAASLSLSHFIFSISVVKFKDSCVTEIMGLGKGTEVLHIPQKEHVPHMTGDKFTLGIILICTFTQENELCVCKQNLSTLLG